MYLSKKCGNAVFMSFWGRQPICGYLTKFFDPILSFSYIFCSIQTSPEKGRLDFWNTFISTFFLSGLCVKMLSVFVRTLLLLLYRYIYPGYDHVTALPLSRLPPPLTSPPPPPPPPPKADCFVSKYTHIRHGSAVYSSLRKWIFKDLNQCAPPLCELRWPTT